MKRSEIFINAASRVFRRNEQTCYAVMNCRGGSAGLSLEYADFYDMYHCFSENPYGYDCPAQQITRMDEAESKNVRLTMLCLIAAYSAAEGL